MKKILMVVIAGLIGATACQKETLCEQPTGIQGEWIWKRSIGGIAGWKFTPESEMATQKLIIDEFTYQAFVNDSLVFSDEYNLDIRPDSFLGTNKYLIFENGGEYAVAISPTELELHELCFDCFSHKYERK